MRRNFGKILAAPKKHVKPISNEDRLLQYSPWLLTFYSNRTESTFASEWNRNFTAFRKISVALFLVFHLAITIWHLFHGLYLLQLKGYAMWWRVVATSIYGVAFLPTLLISLRTGRDKIFAARTFEYVAALCNGLFTVLLVYISLENLDLPYPTVNLAISSLLVFNNIFRISFKTSMALTTLVLIVIGILLGVRAKYNAIIVFTAMLVYVGAAVMSLVFTYAIEKYQRQNFIQQRNIAKNQAKLETQKQRSQELLERTFPKSILNNLDRKEEITQHYNDATIMFVRILNIDPQLSAIATVKCLNSIFSEFDTLTELHQIEKIKTIGPVYMVVGGVPSALTDHAVRMIDLALTLRNHFSSFKKKVGQPNLNIQIGINTGAVIGGIIGNNKIHYDIWSDAVNTASRMEKYGIAGEIQISESTFFQAHHTFNCDERGEMDIKGKGKMRPYIVRERKFSEKWRVTESCFSMAAPMQLIQVETNFGDRDSVEDLLVEYRLTARNYFGWVKAFFKLNFKPEFERLFDDFKFKNVKSSVNIQLGVHSFLLVGALGYQLALNHAQVAYYQFYIPLAVTIVSNAALGLITYLPALQSFHRRFYYWIHAIYLFFFSCAITVSYPINPSIHELDIGQGISPLCIFMLGGLKVQQAICVSLLLHVLIYLYCYFVGYAMYSTFIFVESITVTGITLSLMLEADTRRRFLLTLLGERKHQMVSEQKQKIDKLLHTMLPSEIAARLKKKRNNDNVIAESFTNVSVMVCDVVDFTKLSSTLSPFELINFLNRVFLSIETVLRNYGLEQIKTVGDAMIIASPLSKEHANPRESARKLVDMSIELIHTLDVPLHLGIHTGSILAGVIGRKRFTYDIFGESVDIANDLGTVGTPGKVLITEPVLALLDRDSYEIQPWEPIERNGKTISVYTVSHRFPSDVFGT